jgi:hypothetical protein
VQKAGLYLGAVQLGAGTVLPLAPLSLPYSPEFEPRREPEEGLRALREIARLTGGIERTSWDGVFTASHLGGRQVRDLVAPLTLALLLLHVIEIAGRRLLFFAAARAWLSSLVASVARRRLRLRRTRSEPSPAPSAPTGAQRAGPPPSAPPPKPASSPLARAKARARDRMRG